MKNNFKEMTLDELKVKKDELDRKYMDLRFNKVIGHLENPLEIRNIRRQIAQLNTIIHADKLGIRKNQE